MFAKTLRQLTLLNAIVFFLILLWFGGSLYGFIAYQLFDEVDDAMRDRLDSFRIAGGRPAFGRIVFEPRVYLLVRDGDGNTHALYPYENAETLKEVAAGADTGRIKMLKTGGRFYRSLAAPFSGEDNRLARPDGSYVAVRYAVAVSVVDTEVAMLRRLFVIILAAAAVGVLASIIAGYFLARRALVPVGGAWERQQQFVADASHELRTPLAVIKTNAELVLRYPDRTIQEESARITSILRETIRMSRLVAALLTLARADAGLPELNRGETNLADIIAAVTEQFGPLAEHKGLTLKMEADADLTLAADRERLHQLLVILLDNAVKYTPAGGGVTLTCRKQAGQIALTVADTGCGVPPEDVPRIFDRFFRGDRARSRGEGGTGLGLAIARWIVENHGGKIRAESIVGAGTRIHVTLPVRQ